MKVSFAALTMGLLQLTKLVKSQEAHCDDPDAFPIPPNDFEVDAVSIEDCNATNPTGRHYHCEPWEDGPADGKSNCIQMYFDLEETLQGPRRISIDSCPTAEPPILSIVDDAPPPTPLSPGDVEWLEELRHKLDCHAKEEGEHNCNRFCSFQGIAAIDILLDMNTLIQYFLFNPDAPQPPPPGRKLKDRKLQLPVDFNYFLNPDAEQANQVTTRIFKPGDDPAGPGTTIDLPGSSTPPGTYTSLCYHVGSYMEDPRPNTASDIFALLGPADIACTGGNVVMTLDGGCVMPPIVPGSGLSIAEGSCFGHCGIGCGDVHSLTQYTTDCANYDFCTRFVENSSGPDGAPPEILCIEEFYHTIDDRMWSGNCNLEEQVEEVCQGTCKANERVDLSGVYVTAYDDINPQGPKSCTQVCAEHSETISILGTQIVANPGDFACSQTSLQENDFRFLESNMANTVQGAFNIPCLEPLPAGSSDTKRPYVGPPCEGGICTCYPSVDPRSHFDFDCGLELEAGETRFCTCYIPGDRRRALAEKAEEKQRKLQEN